VLGDSGSGYDIALTAARAVVHANDHDRRWPELGQRFLRALVLNEPEDLVNWAQSAGKGDIAALAVEVFAASEDGDPIAEEVLEFAARSLASDGFACARLVAKPGTPVQFVLAGSVLLKQPRFAGRVRRALLQLWPAALVSPLRGDSAWGAVELARQNVGAAAPRTPPRRQAADPGPAAAAVPPLQSLSKSPTERRHPRSTNLDRLPVESAVELMLQEDKRIPPALLARREEIARGVALIARAFKRGGRLFYVGAGTSGRLGVLDASECPPTFRTPPDMVQGVIAGGTRALWSAVEGAEDDAEAGGRAVASRGVVRQDVVVGIAASGRTPFVWGALGEARRRGASTVLLCFNPHVAIPRGQRPTLVIAPDVGPEILTGSTRLKAGTATKLVLNVFTTLAMVQVGKVRSNLMVDVNASNIKLRDRAVRILQELTGVDYERARQALEKTRWKVPEAMATLEATHGR
jgi:N-acetylmuramic acid 6-phosphate etherase